MLAAIKPSVGQKLGTPKREDNWPDCFNVDGLTVILCALLLPWFCFKSIKSDRVTCLIESIRGASAIEKASPILRLKSFDAICVD